MQHRTRLRSRTTTPRTTTPRTTTPRTTTPRTAAFRTAVIAVGGLGLAVLAASPASAAPVATTATITAPAAVTVGDTLEVDLTLPATTDVFAYQIDLAADADSLEVVDGSVTGPDGGFDSVEQDGDTISLLHTRLGTSPAISGDLAASVELTATSPATVDLAVTRVTVVASDGSTTTLTDPASTTVTIAAAPTPAPTPTPTPTATPTGVPTATPSATPIAGGTDGTGTGTDAGTGTDPVGSTSGRPAGGALAFTGSDLAPWIAASAALLLAGAGLVLARRRARRPASTEDAR
ncbi:cohesin domain-containing protein [Curtobacterium sp. MCBD17_030]|uniref:cohesin domain-containing protein n=1 Tax=Curtobacterium sp. MCBD17_030 TaxID=2175649 RepID=UPI000D868783|nr:cohesin domain-containing protein [Curtobacterium sp. MCBD17_030]PYY35476.1 hypothetical protein DEI89_06935 [Curtobacterium sp. MCBD17_030]